MNEQFELVDSDWSRVIDEAVEMRQNEMSLISPFIKLRVAKRMLKEKKPQLLRVITRFNLADFCDGVSDTDALRFLLDNGAEIRGVKNLHAKLYLFGSRRAIVTSANLTHAALTRNHEFGFVAEDQIVIGRCHNYFESLWKQAGDNLTTAKLAAWDIRVKQVQATGARPSFRQGLGDEGVNAGVITESPMLPPLAQETQQAFVKFFGEGDNRQPRTSEIFVEVKRSGCHWACTYPKGKRPRQVQNGAIMFMGRFVKNPNDIIIYGRAIAVSHNPDRDNATVEEIEMRDWKEKWPHYVRVHHADFLAGTLENGISLNQLMDALGSNSFASTQRNANAGSGNTNPRQAFRSQAAVELSKEGLFLLNAQLEESFARHGKLPDTELETLDWPKAY